MYILENRILGTQISMLELPGATHLCFALRYLKTAQKMYILEKQILGTQLSMLGFFFENLKNYQAQLFYVLRFPLEYLKTVQGLKKCQKMTKTILPLLGHSI